MPENASVTPIPGLPAHGEDVTQVSHSAPSPCGLSAVERLPTDQRERGSRAGESTQAGETATLTHNRRRHCNEPGKFDGRCACDWCKEEWARMRAEFGGSKGTGAAPATRDTPRPPARVDTTGPPAHDLLATPSHAAVHAALTHPRYGGGWLEVWRLHQAGQAHMPELTIPMTHAALRRLEVAGLVERQRPGAGARWRAT